MIFVRSHGIFVCHDGDGCVIIERAATWIRLHFRLWPSLYLKFIFTYRPKCLFHLIHLGGIPVIENGLSLVPVM
jgi:hypothetical protein